jgi:TRL-like protein family
MKCLHCFLLITFSLLNSNCVSSPGSSFFGVSKHHLSAISKNSITSNQILKVGESCSYSSHFGNLFMIYYGVGGSVHEAVEKAGITKIAVIDRSSMVIFPFYYEDCVLVYGE